MVSSEVPHLQWNMSVLNFDTSLLFQCPRVLLDKDHLTYVRDRTIHDMDLTLVLRNSIRANKLRS